MYSQTLQALWGQNMYLSLADHDEKLALAHPDKGANKPHHTRSITPSSHIFLDLVAFRAAAHVQPCYPGVVGSKRVPLAGRS